MTEPTTTVLRLAEVSKSFTGVRALHEVDLDVRAGEVLALMGENGAGKSTLLRIIGGDHLPTSGRLEHHGTPVSYSSPAKTRAAGIRVIAQEPEIVPHVDVAENVFVGVLPSARHRFSRRVAHERLREELDRSGFDGFVDPGELGRRLSPAQRQIVEILRGLVGNPSVVAFDEPTSSLSDPEVDILFALIDRLRSEGTAIIYVSHRMSEIFRIADRVAVLRDGQLVGVRAAEDTSDDELVRMMVGRDVDAMFRSEERTVGAEVLSVRGVTTDDVHDIDLTVRAGEVVALAGLVGAGRSELAKAIVGDLPIRSGVVSMEGTPLRLRSPRDGVRAGIGFAPEERKAEGLILDRSVSDNLTLASLDTMRRFRFIKKATERRITAEYIASLRIKTPSPDQLIRKLSGGNQQKVVLARWLIRRPKLLILDEPTRGVDVGAKAEIYALINGLAEQGTAILVISSELPEVIGLADRILVMRDQTIAGELPAGASEEDILSLAMHGAHAGPAPATPTASTTTTTTVKETLR